MVLQANPLGAGDIGFPVVAHHGHLVRSQDPGGRAPGGKIPSEGLPTTRALRPLANSRAATNGPMSRVRSPAGEPVAVLLQGDQLGAGHQLAEDAVEQLKGKPFHQIAQHHEVGTVLVQFQPLELLDGVPPGDHPAPGLRTTASASSWQPRER